MVVGERKYRDIIVDVFSHLLEKRIVFVTGEITNKTSAVVVAELLHLELQNPKEPIYMIINSPGGVVTAGLAIYDMMQMISCPIQTIYLGEACSMASLLLATGSPGYRFCSTNAKVMIHQPSGAAVGQATDIAIHTVEILKIRDKLNSIYQKHTGRAIEEIEQCMERDFFMDAEQAKKFGIIDSVIDCHQA
ncbi:hypothetical protein LUZ63_015767 [Rhynchospora breviuscula]|uniref:ATP-dependent Clp protease proteolytic subunit n=1 Tax=Rhynchospora breviuscula TaxID=2022672 RepID=A0A9Q0CD79_9POAL|nr:hypothetical protein LUZ63_015767 [Rhynchospora breviuscula]